jgi:type II secretory pathway pseudopilin PulG
MKMDCRLPIADCRLRRGGFSFTEVLFAVMILGIGFIMVAAIFPVAIQQAKTSAEETTGGAVARGAANYLDRVASNSTMPATENVVVGPDYDGRPPYPAAPGFDVDSDNVTIATALRGSLVVAGDSRYGWLPLYRRAGNPADSTTWQPFAQVFMIPVQVRNKTEYRSDDIRMAGGPLVASSKTGVPGTARIAGDVLDGLNGAPDTIDF